MTLPPPVPVPDNVAVYPVIGVSDLQCGAIILSPYVAAARLGGEVWKLVEVVGIVHYTEAISVENAVLAGMLISPDGEDPRPIHYADIIDVKTDRVGRLYARQLGRSRLLRAAPEPGSVAA